MRSIEKILDKKFESDKEYISFIREFINGEYGKILNIERVNKEYNKYYRFFLEDGSYVIKHTHVYLTDWARGPQFAIYYISPKDNNNIIINTARTEALYSRLINEIMVDILFEEIEELYLNQIKTVDERTVDLVKRFFELLQDFKHIQRISDDIYLIIKNDIEYRIVRTTSYNDKIVYNLDIYKSGELVKSFNTTSKVIDNFFDMLSITTQTFRMNRQEIDDIFEFVADLDENIEEPEE